MKTNFPILLFVANFCLISRIANAQSHKIHDLRMEFHGVATRTSSMEPVWKYSFDKRALIAALSEPVRPKFDLKNCLIYVDVFHGFEKDGKERIRKKQWAFCINEKVTCKDGVCFPNTKNHFSSLENSPAQSADEKYLQINDNSIELYIPLIRNIDHKEFAFTLRVEYTNDKVVETIDHGIYDDLDEPTTANKFVVAPLQTIASFSEASFEDELTIVVKGGTGTKQVAAPTFAGSLYIPGFSDPVSRSRIQTATDISGMTSTERRSVDANLTTVFKLIKGIDIGAFSALSFDVGHTANGLFTNHGIVFQPGFKYYFGAKKLKFVDDEMLSKMPYFSISAPGVYYLNTKDSRYFAALNKERYLQVLRGKAGFKTVVIPKQMQFFANVTADYFPFFGRSHSGFTVDDFAVSSEFGIDLGFGKYADKALTISRTEGKSVSTKYLSKSKWKISYSVKF